MILEAPVEMRLGVNSTKHFTGRNQDENNLHPKNINADPSK
jgi:hypothetical protein